MEAAQRHSIAHRSSRAFSKHQMVVSNEAVGSNLDPLLQPRQALVLDDAAACADIHRQVNSHKVTCLCDTGNMLSAPPHKLS